MKLSAVAVVLLALGIVLGLALRGTVFEAEAAKPPAPGPQAVEEQNVGPGGYIAVHEQGTADVNVTNASLLVSGTVDVGNLPSVQDVNVVSMPSQELGPFEFMTITAHQCDSETKLCVHKLNPPDTDWNAEMASLSAQGWSLIETTSTPNHPSFLVFILRKPVP